MSAVRPKSAAKKAGGGMKGLGGAEAAAAAQANACSCLESVLLPLEISNACIAMQGWHVPSQSRKGSQMGDHLL